MAGKTLLYGEEAWKKLSVGVDRIADAVKITLGPRGHNVVLGRVIGSPLITNDGVTIAKEIALEDPAEQAGAQLLIEIASKANDVAGDGTTTAVILGRNIYKEGLKYILSGSNPMAIKKGIQKAVTIVKESLQKLSKPVESLEDIIQVATISANNDKELGTLIATTVDKVGKDGIITVEESRGMDTYLDIVEGIQFDKGYLSPYFSTNNQKLSCEYNNCKILITDKKINSMPEIIPLLEALVKTKQPLLIIADDISTEVLTNLVANKLHGVLNIVAVHAPLFGEKRKQMLSDIAVLTGGVLITGDLNMKVEQVGLDQLGTAKTIKITKDSTMIIEGAGTKEKIDEQISKIKTELEATESSYEKEAIQERLAKFSGGVAILYAGASTETELREKKLRIEDALSATRAAVEEGIVPGGGVALVRAMGDLQNALASNKSAINRTNEVFVNDDELLGGSIVCSAISSPLKQIAENSGESADVVLNNVVVGGKGNLNYGFDANTLSYGDMILSGIVDPLKVTRSAIENASSIAAMLLTTGCIVVDKKEDIEEYKKKHNMV